MAEKPRIAIVGAGNLGAALAVSLFRAGYAVETIVARSQGASLQKAQRLAKEVRARASVDLPKASRAKVVWFCVPDGKIEAAARNLAKRNDWRGIVALHSSGALTSDELAALREPGAAVASVHPLMTFVRASRPSLAGVPFVVEGDAVAVRAARGIVKNLRGQCFPISKKDKVAYHAWGTFASPLLTALLATTEQVAGLAGVSATAARQRMIPILMQTLANYASFGAAGAFSGPIVRGDVKTVKKHLRALRGERKARDVYAALAASAIRLLPTKNRRALEKLID
ncbi:MAG TPA: Rossmann-like and DUF2520 domain-containing protein [Candidatus Solibacter sp.]|nr:Rossmann-like and DUF2520 domain-containing protein [Candidatus Solibacter sp.]